MHVDVDTWKAKCTVCGDEVTFPNWKCSKRPGHHKVSNQIYFHLGGAHIQSLRERRGWGPQVILRAGYEIAGNDPNSGTLVPTVRVLFSGQQVSTEDPEVQFYLETKNDNCIAWGEQGHKDWQRIYLAPEQQKDIANAELAAINRQIAEGNELLAATKKRTAVHA